MFLVDGMSTSLPLDCWSQEQFHPCASWQQLEHEPTTAIPITNRNRQTAVTCFVWLMIMMIGDPYDHARCLLATAFYHIVALMPDLATHHILCIAFTFNRSINYIQNRLTSGNNGDTVVDGGTVAAVIDFLSRSIA